MLLVATALLSARLMVPSRRNARSHVVRGEDLGEEEFLADYDPATFQRPSVAVDVALLTIHQGSLSVLLIERGVHPYKGRWALPGGFLRLDETTAEAAARELEEEGGITVLGHLEQLRTYDAIRRDPRMRVLSVAYVAMMPDLPLPSAGSDAARARWWAVDDLLSANSSKRTLAFDHHAILEDAVERVRSKLEYTTLATTFVRQPFTIGELRHVYETVWGVSLHPQNFRRKVLHTDGFLVPVGREVPTGGPPASLYKRGAAGDLRPPLRRDTGEPLEQSDP